MEKTALRYFLCVIFSFILVISWCYRLSRLADWRRGLVVSGRGCGFGKKSPDRRLLSRFFRSTSWLILTILWFREKGGIGFVICIKFSSSPNDLQSSEHSR